MWHHCYRGLGGYKSEAHGGPHQVCCGLHTEFLADVRAMVFDGFWRYPKHGRDLLDRLAVRNETQHVVLARRQQRAGDSINGPGLPWELASLTPDVCAPSRNRLNRNQQFRRSERSRCDTTRPCLPSVGDTTLVQKVGEE